MFNIAYIWCIHIYVYTHTNIYTHVCIYTHRLITIFYKILQRYVKRKTFCSKACPYIAIHVKNLTITLGAIFRSSWAKNKGQCPSAPVYSKIWKVLVGLQNLSLNQVSQSTSCSTEFEPKRKQQFCKCQLLVAIHNMVTGPTVLHNRCNRWCCSPALPPSLVFCPLPVR